MIYFIQTDCSMGFIKIGLALDLAQRLDKLQNASPYALRVLRVIPGGRMEEKALHERFRADHVRREWFRPSGALLRHIETLQPACLGQAPPREAPSQSHIEGQFVRAAVARARADDQFRRLANLRRT